MEKSVIYNKAKDYLLSFKEINENILNEHIIFNESNCPKDIESLFIKMLEHAKNRQGMPNSIGPINKLKRFLYSFNPNKVLKNYSNWENIFLKIQNNYSPPGRMDINNSRNYWVIFSKSVYSIAEYLTNFKSIDDFYNYVNQFITSTPDTRLALALLLEKEIFGYQFALACDFIKESISSEFIKPDVHIKDIFCGLNLSREGSSDFQIFRDVIRFSKDINEPPYTVDKVFWLIGSGNFYKANIKIKSNKKDFINSLMS